MSAGRYVAVVASWNHWQGPARATLNLQLPAGTRVVTTAEVSGANFQYDDQWLGLCFPSATAARQWIATQCAEWDERPSDYPRFSTLRALEAHLDDVSTAQYLGLTKENQRG